MAHKYREEIVGKRFLSISSGFTKLKGKIRDWNWRAGVIRAATHRDNKNQDIQVLVEYDDVEWQRREWISIYRDNLFHLFLVEQGLVWADRRDPFRPTSGTVIWPALTFTPLVSNLEIPNNLKPIEFLLDRELAFKEYRTLKPYQEWDTSLRGLRDYPELRLAVKRWSELQDGQRILLTTPSVLVGYRVEVYRAEGTTQWYTAVIIGYNEATRDLTVTDDTVLEEHNEDPSLIQMRIIGDGVVESIMRGEVVGITPRRSRSSALLHQQNTQLENRVIRGTIGRTRQSRLEVSDSGISQELANKGKSKKRKPNETDPPTPRARPHHIKEDLENKQTRRKNLNNRSNNKKKVLEEANNSKLREVEIIVEDCLQNGSLFGSQASPQTSSHASESPQNSDNEDVTPEEENVDLDKADQVNPAENSSPETSRSPETPPPCLEKQIEEPLSPPPALEKEEENKEKDKEQDRSIEELEQDNTNNSSELLVNDKIPDLVSEQVKTNTINEDSELVKNLTNVQSESSDIEDNINSENESLRRSSSGSMSDESRRIVKQVVEHILLNSDSEFDSQISDTVSRLRENTKENSDTSSDLNRINNLSNSDLIKEEKVSEIEVDENSQNSTKESSASVEEEEDCVVVQSDKSSDLSVIRETNIIQATSTPVKERSADLDISIRDDEGPLSSSSPFSVGSRMDLDSNLSGSASLMRHSNSFIQADNSDNRSDSGVSSLRSASSGDERSGSRSSALSSTDEPPTSNGSSGGTIQPATRSPLFIPSARSEHLDRVSNSTTQDQVRVWRDPSLLLEEPHIRHVHSIQHHPLLMSHPGAQQAPTGSTAPQQQQQPNNQQQQQHQQQQQTTQQQPTSGSNSPHQRQPPVVSHPASIYPPVPPPSSLMAPHPLGPHHPPLPPHLYHPGFQDILWKQRYGGVPTAHLLQHAAGQVSEEQLMERERAILQDRENTERIIRQREELEKQKRLKERELEKEREKQELEREREREEKERQAQALQIHFEKSLAKAQQKRASELYLSTRPPQSRTSSMSEEDRKQELHQRERERDQQRHLAAVRANEANHRSYYSPVQSKPMNVKSEYPPPPAHSSRMPSNHQQQQQQAASLAKQQAEKMSNLTHQAVIMQKNADLAMYGYSVAHAQNAYYEQKKAEFQHSKASSGLVVTKSGQMERDLPNPPPLVSEMKNSVIVKHDTGKVGHHLEPRVSIALSPSPKLRNDMMGHYMQATAGQYRSPNQSPHHLPPHAASPHHLEAAQKSVQAQHRQVTNQHPSPHAQHHPSQHHSRQSPHNQPQHHPHSQQHPSPEMRFREGQAMIYPAGKPGYPTYLSTTAMSGYTSTPTLSNSKPKVSSPAPHQFYGKPTSGVVSVVPVSRSHDVPMPLNKPMMGSTVSSSPYQQVSLHHPPPGVMTGAPSTVTCPPPAHSSKVSTAPLDRYSDPRYQPGSIPPGGSLSVKLMNQPGASPPISTSVPLPRGQPSFSISPSLQQGAGQVQTQPLDLGVSSNRQEPGSFSPKRKSSTPSLGSPVSLEIKKRRVELCPTPPGGVGTAPSPLGAMRMSPGPLGAGPGSIGSMGVPSATNLSQSQPQLARVSEPSPLIANAATTITTLVNTAAYRSTPVSLTSSQSPTNLTNQTSAILTENLPDLSVTAVSLDGATSLPPRPASTDSTHSIPPKSVTPLGGVVPPSSSPAPPVTASNTGAPTPPSCSTPAPSTAEQEQATTPLKSSTPAPQPSSLDSEKSNSPGPQPIKGGGGGASYPVRHLKKAWLQRHTGEDVEDTTGVIGTGSSVSLPLHINRPSPPPAMNSNNTKNENPVNSIHSVGSMAVNSINKTKHFQNKALNRKTAKETSNVNGHPSDNSKGGDDSSSSDQERGGRKSPPKRKPPKVKRKKGGGPLGKKALEEKKRKGDTKPSNLPSESGSDSDKESGSEKDSDSGASTVVSNNGGSSGGNGKNKGGTPNREPRKRGRRPKGSKNDKGEEPRAKKSKDNEDNEPQRDPFRKPPVGQLKKTGESFLQDGPCFEVAPKLQKCRECRWTPNQRSRNMPNIFCRFYAFRRLRYTKNGQLAIAGFSDPHKDALEEDIKLWLPNTEDPPNDLDLETSRFLLKQVGDHFCDLLLQEKEAHNEHMSEDKTVAWKRVVQGVREMCDVCETTLFNYHWACGKCGFVVCLDCYKSRKNNSKSQSEQKDRDEFNWLLCTNRGSHEQEKLMLTQIIADDCLLKLGRMVHEMRDIWGIEQYCGCPTQKDTKLNHTECKEVVKMILAEKMNGIKEEKDEKPKLANGAVKDEKNSPLNWLADVAIKNEEKPDSEASNNKDNKSKQGSHENSSSEDEGNFSTLRELLIRPSHKANGSSRAASPVSKDKENNKKKTPNSEQDPLAFAMDSPLKVEKDDTEEEKMELKHFVRRYNWQNKGRQQLPIRIMTLTESKILYPKTPHSWLCDGKLLRLSDALSKENYKIFQDQWKRGQPVIVSDVTKNINKDLWNPDAFARDFGDEKNDLINCMTGNLVPNQPMRKFWEGFDHFSKRLRDDKGQPMLLKLKDWPPGEDFAEMLPSRFADLMKVLPLEEYTHRSGRLNLASRLPECFVRPDLGPKMYNAYGSALHPNKGTTNLHLDISDAVNVMVYVGIPKDGDNDEHIREAFKAIDEAGCDILTRRRVRDKGELPGALWHIYNARDADKIRDLLNKVTVEKGGRLEPQHDPIHDQSGYLDGPLRERLYKEYGVEGYAIVQCYGDAVFIPAGAPHQVRNLHNCIKVAEDFVSPENVSHCFHLTQEFRDLSDTHTNHEDKLQIKNIIYHAVKDALSTLGSLMNKQSGKNVVTCDATVEKKIKEEKD